MKRAYAIHHATNNTPGVRGFSERVYAERRVLRAGGNLANLHETGGCFIYWPPSLGAFPTEATLTQWEAQYDARPQLSEAEQLVEKIKADPKALAALKAEVSKP